MNSKIFKLFILINFFINVIIAQIPSWTWVDWTLSSQQSSIGEAIITDISGQSYVTGAIDGPVNFGGILLSTIGQFIVKYDSTGHIIWGKTASGGGTDGISLDKFQNCYVGGSFRDTLINDNDSLFTQNAWRDIYITKYDSSGNFLWARQAGGSIINQCYDIATDSSGNSFVLGTFEDSIRFNNSISLYGNNDGFFAKYDTYGNCIWAKQIKANGISCNSISLDGKNNILITGSFGGTAIFDQDTIILSNSLHLYVAKYDLNGNIIWVKTNVGGPQVNCTGRGISADLNGNILVTGNFRDTLMIGNDTAVGVLNRTAIFSVKLDSSGNSQWIRIANAGVVNQKGHSAKIDNSGNCFVTGEFTDTANFNNTSVISHGSTDVFIAKYSSSGNLEWVKSAGGNSGPEIGNDVSTDDYGNCYLTGIVGSDTAYFDTLVIDDYGHQFFLAKIACNGIQAEISLSGSTLNSTSALTYQWFLNGELIPGATSQTYNPTQNGIYTVYTKDANGCGSFSNLYNLIGLGINVNDNENNISISPNPSKSIFNFINNNKENDIIKIEIRNLLGTKIISTTKKQIDLHSYSDGVYFYSVQMRDGNIIMGRILKQ